jgi:DNA-binding MarR family transcriptional regulator
MESGTVNQASQLPVGVLLSRLGGLSMGRYRKSLKPLELNAQHFVVLKQLEAIGTSSQASLADALGLDYSNLATITGELAERELIERYRHESDKRRYVVELSETGTALLAEADGAVAEHENRLVESLDDEEREQLQVLLRKVADAAELCPSERRQLSRPRGHV